MLKSKMIVSFIGLFISRLTLMAVAKFEPAVMATVEMVCAIGHSLKSTVYSFTEKVVDGVRCDVLSFVSMLKALNSRHSMMAIHTI